MIQPLTESGYPADDVSIAGWLGSTGLNYRSAHYGKWHLSNSGPEANGFDFGDGATANDDGNAADGLTIQTDPKKIFELTSRGIQFMEDAVDDNVPFYLQISHYAVHTAIETTQASFDHFDVKTPGSVHDNVPYAGMMMDMDASIGQVLTAIDNLGIADNTYVIFLSDNGASNGQSMNTPLKRGKAFIYEGGLRVPMFVKGPSISAGSISNEPVVGYDLYPTIAEWTGSSATLPTDLDGESIVPLLEQSTFSRTEPLYFHIPHYSNSAAQSPRSAAVDGNYKLIVEYETGIDYLYDLDADVSESNDIASANQMIVEAMRIKLRNHLKLVSANMPTLDPSHANFSGTAPDIDQDGLEDEWEFRELLSYVQGPTDDPDGDGFNNLMEYNNGTDPLVNETVLAVLENYELRAEIYRNSGVLLSWLNPSDVQVDYFEMEKLTGGGIWSSIGSVNKTAHQFIDDRPDFGQNYYRLKIVNINGTIDYSITRVIDFSKENLIHLYPNPTNGVLHISLPNSVLDEKVVDVLIYNSIGQIVRHFYEEEAKEITLDVKDLPKGIYFIKLMNGDNVLINSILDIF